MIQIPGRCIRGTTIYIKEVADATSRSQALSIIGRARDPAERQEDIPWSF
jgi:hypothetical protein